MGEESKGASPPDDERTREHAADAVARPSPPRVADEESTHPIAIAGLRAALAARQAARRPLSGIDRVIAGEPPTEVGDPPPSAAGRSDTATNAVDDLEDAADRTLAIGPSAPDRTLAIGPSPSGVTGTEERAIGVAAAAEVLDDDLVEDDEDASPNDDDLQTTGLHHKAETPPLPAFPLDDTTAAKAGPPVADAPRSTSKHFPIEDDPITNDLTGERPGVDPNVARDALDFAEMKTGKHPRLESAEPHTSESRAAPPGDAIGATTNAAERVSDAGVDEGAIETVEAHPPTEPPSDPKTDIPPALALDDVTPHPADEPIPTLMERLTAPEVRAVFLAAEERETTAIFRGPMPNLAKAARAHGSPLGSPSADEPPTNAAGDEPAMNADAEPLSTAEGAEATILRTLPALVDAVDDVDDMAETGTGYAVREKRTTDVAPRPDVEMAAESRATPASIGEDTFDEDDEAELLDADEFEDDDDPVDEDEMLQTRALRHALSQEDSIIEPPTQVPASASKSRTPTSVPVLPPTAPGAGAFDAASATPADARTLFDGRASLPDGRPIAISSSDVELVDDDEPVTNTGVRAPEAADVAAEPADVAAERTSEQQAVAPPHVVGATPEEEQLRLAGDLGALVAHYRQVVLESSSSADRVLALLKIASVHEFETRDLSRAFDTLVEAFELRPGDDAVVTAIDRVGAETGRIGELASRVKRSLASVGDPEIRGHLLGHLVYWYERVLGRTKEVAPFLAEIERLDKNHPLSLRKAAQMSALNGDTRAQREHLGRALERSTRAGEKAALHLALAATHAGAPAAQRHFEAALELEPTSLPALQGLERHYRTKENYPQVAWLVDRQIEAATSPAGRIEALLRLADLNESKFVKREIAADLFERVLAVEPGHLGALRGLERCYHALRDWPRLARTLLAHAESTKEKKQKVELLELAAEVRESKQKDMAGAIEIHQELLAIDPKNKRAVGDIARLSEKRGDFRTFATYRARLAELLPSKRLASQELVKLGDLLAPPDRDPTGARHQYERATAIDPTNAAAWEALQRLAVASGDDRRVAECLDQRAKHTEAPRQRALVFVDLARLHERSGNGGAARTAYESAIKADPSNEVAGAAMLDALTRQERFAEAAPICEMLVNAAIRDRNEGLLFDRLRLATRIAAALGEPDRAMTSALAAFEARPSDPGARADLVAVVAQCTELPGTVARAKAALVRILASGDDLPPAVLVMLAGLHRDAGEHAAAIAALERASGGMADDPATLSALADAYLAGGDFARAAALTLDMARNAMTAEARFDLLVAAADIWERRANALADAAPVYEEARALKPLDPWILHTLLRVYGDLGDWPRLAGVLADVVKTQETPAAKVKSLLALAEVLREKIGDGARAAEIYEQILDLEPKRLPLFEDLVRVHTEAKDWEALEAAYRRMLARVKDDDDEDDLTFALAHQLGLIYRDRLGDAERAFEALDAASRLRPDDVEVRQIVTELLIVVDDIDNAVVRLRVALDRDAHDPSLYAELYDLFLRQRYFDKAWCALDVLTQLRPPNEEQQRFLDDYAPMRLAEVPGQILEQAWRTHVFHPDLDATLSQIFALMTPAVARMRHAELRPELAVGRPFTSKHSKLHDEIRRTFANGAEILSMSPPELLLGEEASPVPFTAAFAPFGAIKVSVPALEARAESLVFIVGKRLTEQRPEIAARAFFPSVADLTGLLAAAVRISLREVAKDAAGNALDERFGAVLTEAEREGIRAIVTQASMDGGRVDVRRWSQAADLSSARGGLLLCGDVGTAMKAIAAEPPSPTDLTAREKIGELFRFATSDLYADLRAAIGVSVEEQE